MLHDVFNCAVAVAAIARSMAVWMRALTMLQSLRPALGTGTQSWPECRPKPHLGAVELSQLGVAEETRCTSSSICSSPISSFRKTSLTKTRPLCQLMSPQLFTRRVWNDLGY